MIYIEVQIQYCLAKAKEDLTWIDNKIHLGSPSRFRADQGHFVVSISQGFWKTPNIQLNTLVSPFFLCVLSYFIFFHKFYLS